MGGVAAVCTQGRKQAEVTDEPKASPETEKLAKRIRRGDDSVDIVEMDSQPTSANDAIAVLSSCAKNTVVKHLKLQLDSELSEASVQRVLKVAANSLATNSTIEYVKLQGIARASEGALGGFTASLGSQNQGVTKLELSSCGFGNKELQIILDGLAGSTSLKTLNLANNNIDDDGAETLAERCKDFQTIEEITLDNNGIGTKGATALSKALLGGQTPLRILSLVGNGGISKDAMTKITSALYRKNRSLMVCFHSAE